MKMVKWVASILGILMVLAAGSLHAATFTVTSTSDTSDPGTLRTAIANANGNSGVDVISVLASPISVASSLPPITEALVLEGNGATITSNGNYDLLTLDASSEGCTIRNLILVNTSHRTGTGINVYSTNNIIQGCRIGLDWINTPSRGFLRGVYLHAAGNQVGGNALAKEGNIIAQNSDGICIEGTATLVYGNIIGLSSDQSTDFGNNNGILINQTSGAIIGYPTSGWGNVIAGNDNYGVGTYNDSNNKIQNNLVGVNQAGTAFNNGYGVYVYNGNNNLIGGNGLFLEGNIISGNSSDGIYIYGLGNSVCGNVIGLSPDQTTARPNFQGVELNAASHNAIGLPITGWGNVIAGNSGYGISVYNDSELNRIQNNSVGLSGTGSPFANYTGIYINNAGHNLIGGNSLNQEGNVVSGNSNGIRLSVSSGNTVCGNVIGLDAGQNVSQGNDIGIEVNSSQGNVIGQPITGWGNVIAGNTHYGILGANTSWLKIQHNSIGLNSTGTVFSNGYGVQILQGGCNLVGGNGLNLAGNVISGSLNHGIYLNQTMGNTVCGNVLGLNAGQTVAAENHEAGVCVNQSAGNAIGLPIAGWGNVISGGGSYGINLQYANDNTIQNNLIGKNNSVGSLGLTNGIYMTDSSRNLIGGLLNPAQSESNVIAGNTWGAIYMVASHWNTISGNLVNLSLDGLTQVSDAGEQETIYMWGCDSNLIGGDISDPNQLHGNIITGQHTGFRLCSSSAGNTLVGNWVGVLADQSHAPISFTTTILINQTAHDNLVGGAGGHGNLITGGTTGISLDSVTAVQNGIFGNTITSFSSKGIELLNSANGSKQAPVINSAMGHVILGTAQNPGDIIELFKAEAKPAGYGGSLRYLGRATAIADLSWSVTTSSTIGGDYLCATSSQGNNTSEFSANALNAGPTATPTVTPTVTSTSTPTSTITPTATSSQTFTITCTTTATRVGEDINFKGHRALAYPNPGRRQMTFAVAATPKQKLAVNIYNLNGERLVTLNSETQAAKLVWNCTEIAPGLYMARIFVDGTEWETLKIAVLR